jgi:hypothetical protein
MKKFALVSASVLALTLLTGCPVIRPIAKTVADVAHELCIQHYQEAKPGMSPEDIAHGLCATEEALRPFIEAILSAKQQLARQTAAAAPSAPCPSTVILTLAPIESAKPTAPAPSAKPVVSPATSASVSAKK